MSDTVNKCHRQRLRGRLASGEESSRSEEALLELLLTYAIPQKDVQPLAKRPAKEALRPAIQATLFESISPEKTEQTAAVKDAPRREKVAPRLGTEMFGKAVLKEAIQILPSLPDTESLDEIRSFGGNEAKRPEPAAGLSCFTK